MNQSIDQLLCSWICMTKNDSLNDTIVICCWTGKIHSPHPTTPRDHIYHRGFGSTWNDVFPSVGSAVGCWSSSWQRCPGCSRCWRAVLGWTHKAGLPSGFIPIRYEFGNVTQVRWIVYADIQIDITGSASSTSPIISSNRFLCHLYITCIVKDCITYSLSPVLSSSFLWSGVKP